MRKRPLSAANPPNREEDPDRDVLLRPPWDDDPGPADAWLGPAWLDPADEADPPPLPRRRRITPGTPPLADPAALLAPIAAAQDALSRLDALAEAAPAPIRTGLVARLALREATGWLASRHAWVHPHDLALRTANLAGRFDTAVQIGRPRQALPNTLAARRDAWDDPEDLATAAAGEQAAVRALALARWLTALPRRHDPLATAEAAEAFLAPLGAGAIDAGRFAAWRAATLAGNAQPGNSPALPPLLHAAQAALGWMESGATDQPDAQPALAIAALLLARRKTLRVIPLPFWSAWPSLGQPEDAGWLPRLRPALARKLAGIDRAPWPLSFLTFAVEAARAGLRELDRLQTAAATGEKLAAALDRRSRLPAAVALVLASPVVTPRGLAETLDITLQAANRILDRLERAGIVKEVTGRASFRGFGV